MPAKKVFISHKAKDRNAAETIRRALSLYGAGNLEIFVSERISAGTVWAPEIWDSLEHADWLLLLYTDPSEDWDWCLFETGFFAASARKAGHRLVCLHTGDTPPPMPLQAWQSVPVTDGPMLEKFLKELFAGINKELVDTPSLLQGLADKIAGAFKKEIRRKLASRWFTKYVTLTLDGDLIKKLIKTGAVPADALCGLNDQESLYIFGHGAGQCTMQILEDGLDPNYRASWLTSLGETLRAVSLNKTPVPRIPILYSPSTQKDYHVVLHCVHHFSDGSKTFYLLFVEKIPENEQMQGHELQHLGNMLKLGRTFRWKILTTFQREVSVLKQRKGRAEEIATCLERLRWSINWIVGESQRLDILTVEDVLESFEKEEDKKALGDALENVWPSHFKDMLDGIEASDLDKVLGAIKGMLEVNKDYMIRAAARYKELLEKLL